MWSAYHSLRTSHEFVQKWIAFISAVIEEQQPNHILIQFLTDQFFQQMIKNQCPLDNTPIVQVQQQGLMYEECNALHYTAGAVCCTLKKRISKSNHPSKKDLMIGIDDLCCDDDEEGAKEWVELIDRGGLCHVKDETYQLFYAMELVVRQHLIIKQAGTLGHGSRAEIEMKMLEDEEVLFAWSIASVELRQTLFYSR